mmetsp:Transcript_60610/g.116832  ORF Transcript_60610/g.116832 Transcript_60610/m.116832 type:complete len:326 (-) Transcript_60610:36-1013(-)
MKTQVVALATLLGQCIFALAETRLRQLQRAQGLHMDTRLPLSLASTNSDEHYFVQFLEAERPLESGSEDLPPYADFMPACLEHTKDMVQSLDHGYTDEQLRQVLEHECQRDKEFTTVEDGFDGHKACFKFATELTAARNKELKTGSDKGYTKFCERFFVHKGGEKPRKEKKEAKAKMKKPKKNKPHKEQDSDETYALAHAFAPASAPAASPLASPMASPAASPAPGPAPGPAFAPAPAPGPIFAPAPAEAKSKCDLVYDAEYKRQMDMGRSNERAKKEATAARDRCLGINSKSRKGETQWWAIAIIVGGVLAFIIAGGIVHYRNS